MAKAGFRGEAVGSPFRVEHAGASKRGVLIAWPVPEPGYFGAAPGCLAAQLPVVLPAQPNSWEQGGGDVNSSPYPGPQQVLRGNCLMN